MLNWADQKCTVRIMGRLHWHSSSCITGWRMAFSILSILRNITVINGFYFCHQYLSAMFTSTYSVLKHLVSEFVHDSFVVWLRTRASIYPPGYNTACIVQSISSSWRILKLQNFHSIEFITKFHNFCLPFQDKEEGIVHISNDLISPRFTFSPCLSA